MPEPTPPLAFEAVIARLEAIARRLEGDDVPLEEALALFEEGARLARVGGQRLDDAEERLTLLASREREEPLTLATGEDEEG